MKPNPSFWLKVGAVLALWSWLGSGRALYAGPAPTNPQWEKEVQAFEAADKTNPPPKNAILFIGSSSTRLWKTLAQDFPEQPVAQGSRGLR